MLNKVHAFAGRHRKGLAVCLLVIFLLGFVMAVLSCANPQRSKWIYLWQAYYSPGRLLHRVSRHHSNWTEDRVLRVPPLDPPADFDGTWRDWSPRGELLTTTIYVKGRPVSLRAWYPDGQPQAEWFFDEQGRIHGLMREWSREGKLLPGATFDHGQITTDTHHDEKTP